MVTSLNKLPGITGTVQSENPDYRIYGVFLTCGVNTRISFSLHNLNHSTAWAGKKKWVTTWKPNRKKWNKRPHRNLDKAALQKGNYPEYIIKCFKILCPKKASRMSMYPGRGPTANCDRNVRRSRWLPKRYGHSNTLPSATDRTSQIWNRIRKNSAAPSITLIDMRATLPR